MGRFSKWDQKVFAVMVRNKLEFCDMFFPVRPIRRLRAYQWLEWWADKKIEKLRQK